MPDQSLSHALLIMRRMLIMLLVCNAFLLHPRRRVLVADKVGPEVRGPVAAPNVHRKEVVVVRSYELMFIVNPDLEAEETEGIISRVAKAVTDQGGQIQSIERWGKRRLAYEIAGHRYGNYTVVTFGGPGGSIGTELERVLGITDGVIRYLIVKRPPASATVPAGPVPDDTAVPSPAEAAAEAKAPKEAEAAAEAEAPDGTATGTPAEAGTPA